MKTMKTIKTATMLTLALAASLGLAACDPGSLIPGGGASADPCADAGHHNLCVPPVDDSPTPGSGH